MFADYAIGLASLCLNARPFMKRLTIPSHPIRRSLPIHPDRRGIQPRRLLCVRGTVGEVTTLVPVVGAD
jgi:hypothetical protein